MITRIFIAIFCIIFWVPIQGMAQQTIGIDWDVPAQPSEVEAELQHFSELGISHLQVHQSLDDNTWNTITDYNFTVYGKLPVNFPISQTFSKEDSSFKQNLQHLLNQYNQQPSVQAIGLFSYGNWSDSTFQQAVDKFAGSIKADTSKERYYITVDPQNIAADSLFDFKIIGSPALNNAQANTARIFLYCPNQNREWDIGPVKQLLELSRPIQNSIVFFNSSWLKQMEQEHPNFASTLNLYATAADPAFPLPKQKEHPHYSNNLIIVMLLLAWIVLAAAYNYNPVYRRSLLRYYSGHHFYVNDVMGRHIRSMFAGISILLQHGIAGGIILYCVVHIGISSLGLEAIYYHYPIFSMFGDSPLAIFLSGFTLTICIQTIMVLWLWLVNSKTAYLSQIINLYPWALQFNLVIATITLGLYLANTNLLAIYLLSILFILLFICSFIVTAVDTGRFVHSNRKSYFAATIGIYLVLLAGVIGWLLASQEVQQVIQLAGNLP